MKKLIILALLLISTDSFTQVNIESFNWKTKPVFTSLDLTGSASDTSSWIYIGDFHYFNLYSTLATDSANWDLALDDSLGFDIDYELHHGRTKPVSGTAGFRPKSTLAQTEITSYTIADTAWVDSYQSMHTIALAISPGTWIRFYTNKDAIQVLTRNLTLTTILWCHP